MGEHKLTRAKVGWVICFADLQVGKRQQRGHVCVVNEQSVAKPIHLKGRSRRYLGPHHCARVAADPYALTGRLTMWGRVGKGD